MTAPGPSRAIGQAVLMVSTVPVQGRKETKWEERGLVLLFLSVFNIIQKKRLKTNLPYFVLGPVFPGYSCMWAAALQRLWQLTSRAKGAAVSLVSASRSTGQAFRTGLELVLYSWSLRKTWHSDGSCWSVDYLAHTLSIHTGQSHLSVVGVGDSWTA